MKALRISLLGIVTLMFVSPLLFMVLTSFKSRQEAAQTPPTLFPKDPTLQAYDHILHSSGTPVLQWFANSLIAATANAAIVVATAALAAYALARMDFPGRKIVFWVIVATL